MKPLLRDTWLVSDAGGNEIATIQEDSAMLGLLRRGHELLAALIPQTFNVTTPEGGTVASFRTHMNPFVYRLSVRVHEDHQQLDELVLLGSACLLAAIEGRQG